MRAPQLELWSAEPHPAPPIYQHLTPQQQSQLIRHLVQLILKMVPAIPTRPSPVAENQRHER